MLNQTGQQCHFLDLEFSNNGSTGSAHGVTLAIASIIERCVFHDFRGAGLAMSSGGKVIECEAYNCNQSNTANTAGFQMTSSQSGYYKRCISHNNSGSNTSGFIIQSNNGAAGTVVEDCIADTNGLHGILANAATAGVYILSNCTSYGNGGDGFRSTSSTNYFYIENCLFANNGGYGVNQSVTATVVPQRLVNCGFYSNSSGETNGINASFVQGSISFPASPMIDAANGNFMVRLASGIGSGRGAFLQSSGYTGSTLSKPDIGAVQQAGGQATAVFTSFVNLGRRHFLLPRTRIDVRYIITPGQPVPFPVVVTERQRRSPEVQRVLLTQFVPLPAPVIHVPIPIIRIVTAHRLVRLPAQRHIFFHPPELRSVIIPGRRAVIIRQYRVREAPRLFSNQTITNTSLVVSQARVVR